jgi:hypothetical protein
VTGTLSRSTEMLPMKWPSTLMCWLATFPHSGGTDGGTVPRNRLNKPDALPVNAPAKPFTPVRFR